jgi:uncharacterized protein
MTAEKPDHQTTKQKPLGRLDRTALVFAGHAFVGLGIIGAILPLMPTTVFLLLAATCYARSSPRFYHWLLHNRYFGSYIRNYKEKQGTPLPVKLTSMAVLWITILFSIYSTSAPWYVDVLLLLIAIGVTVHLIMIKTLKN